ncbi:MutS-related protein [Xanthovirga aplysinae]|uniref:MutS-related protein n=1 Tax=Xanthovirga aplysinae TaxID=2529853 RepID=UPI0012BC8381|nr:DNA mismatch repair protein MutS [Xanthovirga aplysinae]MTI31763.1 DNA mismatch repair protein MutS [Xanthovirga aplysinae]
MRDQILKNYQKRKKSFAESFQRLSKKSSRLSWLRVLLFLAYLISVVFLANIGAESAFLLLLFIGPIGFAFLVRYHNRISYEKKHNGILKEINEEEIARLKGKLRGLPSGDTYLEADHPYALDLDIFGQNSLFQLLCRATTSAGKEMLAKWLLKGAQLNEVESRQEAVKELSQKLEWRQNFQASGRHYEVQEEENHTQILLNWLKEPNKLSRNPFYVIGAWLLPLSVLAYIPAMMYLEWNYYGLSVIVLLNIFFLGSVQAYAQDTHRKTSGSVKTLKAYSSLIGMIEGEEFSSNKLKGLQAAFKHENQKSSTEIKRLGFILDNLDSRANLVYHIFNILFILDIQWLLRAERWRSNMKSDVNKWFEAISEFEVLSGMAALNFSNPDFAIPQIVSSDHQFKAQELGHPLIPAEKRVCNDFELDGIGSIAIVTGSNMSGKSTFERTMGINTVLALAGAPVCAKAMVVSQTQVFTSMRTIDSLEESVSSFYAELKRLRQLLDLLQDEKPVLFMLDEILKGTNSHDRHEGAAALIRQLKDLNASGLVSTHDIKLSELAKESDQLKNFSFESQIEGDEILFDYKIHEGPCRSFNASKLMEKMGIKGIAKS